MANNPEVDAAIQAWRPYIDSITDWEKLVEGVEPKATGWGPVYEFDSPLPERGEESSAIADMRDLLVSEPHYHPNGETEVYVILSGLGKVIVGGEEQKVETGSVVVTPPNTTHFTIPESNLVLAVLNLPSFNPANYKPITDTEGTLGFDQDQFSSYVEEAYRQRGLEVESGFDKPGTIYEPHKHEKTYLYTVSGSISIKLDGGEAQDVQPHQEFIVGGNQLHEAVVGEQGWRYVAAYSADEAAQYAH